MRAFYKVASITHKTSWEGDDMGVVLLENGKLGEISLDPMPIDKALLWRIGSVVGVDIEAPQGCDIDHVGRSMLVLDEIARPRI